MERLEVIGKKYDSLYEALLGERNKEIEKEIQRVKKEIKENESAGVLDCIYLPLYVRILSCIRFDGKNLSTTDWTDIQELSQDFEDNNVFDVILASLLFNVNILLFDDPAGGEIRSLSERFSFLLASPDIAQQQPYFLLQKNREKKWQRLRMTGIVGEGPDGSYTMDDIKTLLSKKLVQYFGPPAFRQLSLDRKFRKDKLEQVLNAFGNDVGSVNVLQRMVEISPQSK